LTGATGYVYDPLFLEHDLPGHPESRARLEAIMAELASAGLLQRMRHIGAQPVEGALLRRVHDPAHIERVERISGHGGGFLDPDTYLVARSYEAALLAAGGTVELARAVLRGELHNGIALVRPPGHHAERSRGMGFCLFNNIAVAAQVALDEFGLRRVLIFDWDVHHGNGTQDIFYESPEVLFISAHQYPHYPGTGDWREAGKQAGLGYTVNLPLPAGVGDDGFARLAQEVLVPLAGKFRPELILVSAGYDGHWRDPLAGLHLSLAGYWQLSCALVQLAEQFCDGRLVITLEGGYNLPVLAGGVADTCRALLHEEVCGVDSFGGCGWPESDIERLMAGVRKVHGVQPP
jgi:acetoin utilization deacetylase AcuC-like enzyme